MAAEDWKAKVSSAGNTLGKGTARALLRSEGNIQSRLLSSRIERFLINLAVMPLQCYHSCCHLSLVPPKTQKENCWQCPLRIDLRDYPWWQIYIEEGHMDFIYRRNSSVLSQVKPALWKRHSKSKGRQFRLFWHTFFSLRKSVIDIPPAFQCMRCMQVSREQKIYFLRQTYSRGMS